MSRPTTIFFYNYEYSQSINSTVWTYQLMFLNLDLGLKSERPHKHTCKIQTIAAHNIPRVASGRARLSWSGSIWSAPTPVLSNRKYLTIVYKRIDLEQTLILWVYWEPVWDETLTPIQLVLSLQNPIHFGFIFPDLVPMMVHGKQEMPQKICRKLEKKIWLVTGRYRFWVTENQKNCLKAAENWLKAVENRKSGKPERDG